MAKYGNLGWAWKPDIYSSYAISRQKRKDRKKQKKKNQGFYDSSEWRKVRYQALKRHRAACMLCGRGASNNIVLHVDHIKPRSKYPELELEVNNLQVLCEDCNIGKSNIDETDWRK